MAKQAVAPILRVAVATKSGQAIDQHFGHAEGFAVYEVDDGHVRFVEDRRVEHYCQGGFGDEEKREAIVRALADCQACFVARIGEGPRQRLAAAGIEAVDDYPFGPIVPSVAAWYGARQAGDSSG